MPRFIVSFFSDSQGIRSHLVEADSKDLALRRFFDEHVADYSKDSEGFAYFREDFGDSDRPLGAMVELGSQIVE